MATLQTWDEIVASTLRSDKTIREELHDAITNVSVRETPLLSTLQQVPVENNHVQWLIDSYRASAANANLEGIAYTAQALTVPTRADNTTQIFYESGQISDRQRKVLHAGMDDPLPYYEFKSFVEMKKDMELALIKGSAITGDTDTASQLGGFMNILSTNKTDMSGVTMTEILFNDVLEMIWDDTEAYPTDVYVGPKLKRTISLYATKNTPFLSAEERKQVLVINQYDSEFGILMIYLHRDLDSAAATANEMLVIDPNFYATGWLQPVRREVLSRDGKRDRFQLSGEFTLVFGNEVAGGAVSNWRPYIV